MAFDSSPSDKPFVVICAGSPALCCYLVARGAAARAHHALVAALAEFTLGFPSCQTHLVLCKQLPWCCTHHRARGIPILAVGLRQPPRECPNASKKRREGADFGVAEEPEVQHPQLHFCSQHCSIRQGLLVSSQPILDTPNIFKNPGSPMGSAVPLPSPGAEPAWAARAALPSLHSDAHTPHVCIIPGYK